MKNQGWERTEAPVQTIEENWLFRLVKEGYRSRATGREHDYYVMKLPDAVNVIAVTEDKSLVMVRQFRAGSGKDSLETPGGLVDAGEDVLDAAARELVEETGYEGDTPEIVSTYWANPSILSSRIVTVLIQNARLTRAVSPDEHEEVAVELVPVRRIPQMIRAGEIGHALVVQGLQSWLLSELPGFERVRQEERAVGRPRSIQWLMGLVAVVGVVAAMVRVLGAKGPLLLAFLSFPLGYAATAWVLHDLSRPIVLRGFRMSNRYRLARAVAAFWVGISVFFLMLMMGMFWN